MAVVLYLNHVFTASKEDTATITVLGEAPSSSIVPDETVTINLTLAAMNSILSITETDDGSAGSQLSDNKQYPALTFTVPESAVTAIHTSENDNANLTATFSVDDEDENYWLTLIPHDAIKGVQVTPGTFETAFPTIAVSAGEAANTETNAAGAAVQNLFEQVVHTNRLVSLSTDSISRGGPSRQTAFVNDDVISIFVTYTATTSRTYTVDGDVATVGTSTGATFKHSLSNKTLTTEVIVAGGTLTKTVKYNLICPSPPRS